jgi:hypothetical protein
MMDAKYTPGPWEVFPYLTPHLDDDPMMVYKVNAGDLQQRFDNLQLDEGGQYDDEELDRIHEEKAANARLIASAPDLLEALEGLLANAPQPSKKIKESFHYLVSREAACKAIAKAKGE